MLVGTKISNDELKSTITELRRDRNSDANRRVIPLIVQGQYVVPAKLDPMPQVDKDGKILGEGKFQVNFAMITDGEKKTFFPCFTDNETYMMSSMADNKEMVQVIMPYEELANIVNNSNGRVEGFVVNPYTEPLPVPKDLIDKIREHKKVDVTHETKQVGTDIKLRTPNYLPIDMMEEAKKMFAEEDKVRAAYLQMMETEEEDEHYLVTIDYDGDEKAFFEKVVPVLQQYSFGIKVALTPAKNSLGQMVMRNAEPFYKR